MRFDRCMAVCMAKLRTSSETVEVEYLFSDLQTSYIIRVPTITAVRENDGKEGEKIEGRKGERE